MSLVLAAAGLIACQLAGALAAGWPRLAPRLGSRRVLIASAGFGLLTGLAAALAPALLTAGWLVLAGAVLAYVGLVDLRRFSIPLPGLILLAGLLAFDLWRAGEVWPRLTAGLAAGLSLALLRRLGGDKGMGAGDPPLAALAAALVGWKLASAVIAAAALAPLVLQLMTRRRGPVPFGFWLCLATAVALAFPR